MKKKGWEYVLKNDKMTVFCKKTSKEISSQCDNDIKQYEMVKSVCNRDVKKIFQEY
jgi:hypothetical protein